MSNRVILALGADIKNRFLVANGKRLYVGPDIGDLSIAENYELFKKELNKAIRRFRPDTVAYDLHPGYFSTRIVKEDSQLSTLNSQLSVQHHHAHIASVLAEHNLKRAVIGVAFDGTGFGADANIWGGEFLLANGAEFKRLAHLKYRAMPGADKAVYEPWRMALSILGKKAVPFIKGINKKDMELVLAMLKKGVNSPLTSSAGRLFDAAATLIGLCNFASYEAEGPIKLEKLSEQGHSRGQALYTSTSVKRSVPLSGAPSAIDTDFIFLGIIRDLAKGLDKSIIATRFHNSIAEVVISTVKQLSRKTAIKTVALSGGVFQNRFLRAKVAGGLSAAGLGVFTNIETPVNDLNISLGQYYVSCCACKG